MEDAERLSKFMGYFQGNLAREVARLTGWDDKVWARRYQAILVTDEEAAQVDRLKYLLENSCKEGLVDSPIHWPGVHCARALISGDRVEGTWFDRKLEYNARLQGKEPGPREFATAEEVLLSPLPCWRHMEPKAYRARMTELVREIEEAATAEYREAGREPLGEEGVQAQDPETRPRKIKKSPAPFVHAATKAARKAMWEAYGWFVAAFRDAAEMLKTGDQDAVLPGRQLPAGVAVRGSLRRRLGSRLRLLADENHGRVGAEITAREGRCARARWRDGRRGQERGAERAEMGRLSKMTGQVRRKYGVTIKMEVPSGRDQRTSVSKGFKTRLEPNSRT